MEKNRNTNNEILKFILLDYLIAIYFFLSPLEFAINAIVPGGSSLKYVGAVILIVLIIYAFKHKTLVQINPIHILFVLWLFFEILSYFWSPYNEYAFTYILTYSNMTLFFILLTLPKFERKTINFFINSTLLGSTFSAIIMLTNLTGYHGSKIRHSFSFLGAQLDPNNAAAFLTYGVVLSIHNLIINGQNKYLYGLALFINLVALFYTGSRGGLVAVIIITIVIFFYYLIYNFNLNRFIRLAILIAIISFTSYIIIGFLIPDQLLSRLLEFSSYEDNNERIVIWKYAIGRIFEKPLFGYGIGSFSEISKQLFWHTKGMHNTYLSILVETGITGFLLFVSGIISLLVKTIKKKYILALILLLAAIIPAIFLDSLVKRYFWNGLILCFIMIRNYFE